MKTTTVLQGYDEETEAIVTGRLAGHQANNKERRELDAPPAIRGSHNLEKQQPGLALHRLEYKWNEPNGQDLLAQS